MLKNRPCFLFLILPTCWAVRSIGITREHIVPAMAFLCYFCAQLKFAVCAQGDFCKSDPEFAHLVSEGNIVCMLFCVIN